MADFQFSPDMQNKSYAEKQNVLAGNVGLDALEGLWNIINAQGLTPQQRAMFSAAMNRNLGMQAEQAGQGLGRRFAAQGIAGTGLANSALGQIQSGLLEAQQEGEEGLNKMGLDLYQNALQSGLSQNQFFRDLVSRERNAAKDRKSRVFSTIFGGARDVGEAYAGGGGQ